MIVYDWSPGTLEIEFLVGVWYRFPQPLSFFLSASTLAFLVSLFILFYFIFLPAHDPNWFFLDLKRIRGGYFDL